MQWDPLNVSETSLDSENTKRPLSKLSNFLFYLLLINPFPLFRLTRRDMDTRAKRFWRYENAFLTLIPVDET